MAEQLTPAQAERIETGYRRLQEHALGFQDFYAIIYDVARQTGSGPGSRPDDNPYWPYGWKAKEAGA